MEVLNELGHGLNEKLYENALTAELTVRDVRYDQQKCCEVIYKGDKVGTCIHDLVVFGTVVVDTKSIEEITDHERGKMLNYLKITELRIGAILNFCRPNLVS